MAFLNTSTSGNDDAVEDPPVVLAVRQHVLDRVNVWRDSRREQRGLFFTGPPLTRHEAVFIADNLRHELPLEATTGTSGMNQQTTQLVLAGMPALSDEAANDVFCGFLQEAPCLLVSLALIEWHRSPQQLHRLLQALHHNTSVQTLRVQGRLPDDNDCCTWMRELFRHKTDFTNLQFVNCRFRISTNLSSLLSGLMHLKILELISCRIDDQVIQVILQGKYPTLVGVSLVGNEITSHGLGFMAHQIPESLPSLERLSIACNPGLLDCPETTPRFIKNVLPMLKALDVAYCGNYFAYIPIIKACETEIATEKLEHLDMCTRSNPYPVVLRDQLVESLAKMKVKYLWCAHGLFTGSDGPLMAALYKNTTIVWPLHGDENTHHHVGPILKRNKLMANVNKHLLLEGTTRMAACDSMINNEEKNNNSIITPLGRWSRVLAEVGHVRVIQGATPVYMILRAVLAQWVLEP
jgi:hypothetical protein